MGRFLALTILVAAIGFIMIQLFKFFVSINSSRSQVRRDVEELKLKMMEMVKGLVPMNKQELELLSVNQSDVNISRGINSVKTGAFTSIYNEPLLAYAYKNYSAGNKSVLLVSTNSDDFIYMSEGSRTKVFLNNSELGVIDSDGNMYDPVSKQQMARIEADHVLSSHPVKIGEKEIGEIVNLRLKDSPNPRAYQFLEPMNKREEDLFKALTFLSLVEESI
ncbi:MAG: hypothetical protein AAGA77_15970 [Bacteroidota bacterium]